MHRSNYSSPRRIKLCVSKSMAGHFDFGKGMGIKSRANDVPLAQNQGDDPAIPLGSGRFQLPAGFWQGGIFGDGFGEYPIRSDGHTVIRLVSRGNAASPSQWEVEPGVTA